MGKRRIATICAEDVGRENEKAGGDKPIGTARALRCESCSALVMTLTEKGLCQTCALEKIVEAEARKKPIELTAKPLVFLSEAAPPPQPAPAHHEPPPTQYIETQSTSMSEDMINQPNHYTWHPVAECRDIVQEFSYNIGTAIAYLWRVGRKLDSIEDLKKAKKHIDFEIERLTKR